MPAQTRSMLKRLNDATPAPEKPAQIITPDGVILLSQNEVDELGIDYHPHHSCLTNCWSTRCVKIRGTEFRWFNVLFSPANNINTYQDIINSGKEFALAPEGFYWKCVNLTSYYSDMEYWDLQRIPITDNARK